MHLKCDLLPPLLILRQHHILFMVPPGYNSPSARQGEEGSEEDEEEGEKEEKEEDVMLCLGTCGYS